ncbi:MAG: helix-turn-helix transcriptional regulator [Roseburia sp.]|nr:helix-turn-helix transcriptional regulator [Roseburia sp.]
MIKYKIDILKELKEKGFTTTKIRKNKILSESTLQRIRDGKTSISCDSIGTICSMLQCQPGDILQNELTEEEKSAFI